MSGLANAPIITATRDPNPDCGWIGRVDGKCYCTRPTKREAIAATRAYVANEQADSAAGTVGALRAGETVEIDGETMTVEAVEPGVFDTRRRRVQLRMADGSPFLVRARAASPVSCLSDS
jgi:hypothetical protein